MSEQENGGRHNQSSGEQCDSGMNDSLLPRKIVSVLELARYKIGGSAWWVVLRYNSPLPKLSESAAWMHNCHPKVLYENGPYRYRWPYKAKLPKLHHADFSTMLTLLTSELIVEKFDICEVIRSNDTGEFFYSNQDDEWIPESSLFDTHMAARREHNRIIKMIKRWADVNDQEK